MQQEQFLQQLRDSFAAEMSNKPKQWVISDRLHQKITEDGRMKPFFGATSVIHLSERDIASCNHVQEALFRKHPDMFVQIDQKTFHVTVHAFSNPYTVSHEISAIRQDIEKVRDIIENEFRKLAGMYHDRTIRMKALGASTAGKDVVSLKFEPSNEEDHLILIDLFQRFEAIYPLGSAYIPHVSLGYFKLVAYSVQEIDALYETLTEINAGLNMEIELELNQLAFQIHYDMNDFRDQFMLGDFHVL